MNCVAFDYEIGAYIVYDPIRSAIEGIMPREMVESVYREALDKGYYKKGDDITYCKVARDFVDGFDFERTAE